MITLSVRQSVDSRISPEHLNIIKRRFHVGASNVKFLVELDIGDNQITPHNSGGCGPKFNLHLSFMKGVVLKLF